MTASPEHLAERLPERARRPIRRTAPGRPLAILLPVVLLLSLAGVLLAGCSIFRLGKDLEVLYTEAVFIPGQVNVDPRLRGQPVVLLVQHGAIDEAPVTRRLIDYRFPDGRQRFNFQTRAGDYELMAFLDQNRDFIYQPGEPAFVAPETAVTNRLDTQSGRWRFNILDWTPETTRVALPIDVDLTPVGLQSMPRTATTMGVPIDFDSFRFDPEYVALGMWEPTRWYMEVDYGFYLYGSWDPSVQKPMLLLVHGINGSPRDFEPLLAKLDTSAYKVALYHYPSGIGLDDNAYMLAQIMNELQIRAPRQQYVLLAHSMGGLVSKRFIQLQEDSGRADLIARYITISTPWDGHRAAAAGAKHSPVVAPVWKDLAPGSRFIRRLADRPLPLQLEYTMIFGYGGSRAVLGDANDGVVSLDSQLSPGMQDRANVLIGVSQDHTGILADDRTVGAVAELLEAPMRR